MGECYHLSDIVEFHPGSNNAINSYFVKSFLRLVITNRIGKDVDFSSLLFCSYLVKLRIKTFEFGFRSLTTTEEQQQQYFIRSKTLTHLHRKLQNYNNLGKFNEPCVLEFPLPFACKTK